MGVEVQFCSCFRSQNNHVLPTALWAVDCHAFRREVSGGSQAPQHSECAEPSDPHAGHGKKRPMLGITTENSSHVADLHMP